MSADVRTIHVRDRTFDVIDRGEVCYVDGEQRSFWDVFESDGYDPQLLDLIDRLVKPLRIFVDVGAWVGAVTLYAAAGGAHVVAIEPDPYSLTVLKRNVTINPGFPGGIACVRRAITAEREPAYVSLVGPLGRGLTRVDPGPGTTRTQTTTLQDLISSNDQVESVALVKVDIEGGEVELMPTLGPWLAEQGIPVIVSMHGTEPDPAWFSGYKTVAGGGTHGDVVGLPFFTMDERGLAVSR